MYSHFLSFAADPTFFGFDFDQIKHRYLSYECSTDIARRLLAGAAEGAHSNVSIHNYAIP